MQHGRVKIGMSEHETYECRNIGVLKVETYECQQIRVSKHGRVENRNIRTQGCRKIGMSKRLSVETRVTTHGRV